MKLSHVTILIAGLVEPSSAGDYGQPQKTYTLQGNELARANAYLSRNFPNMGATDQERYKTNLATMTRGHDLGTEGWKMAFENGTQCLPQATYWDADWPDTVRLSDLAEKVKMWNICGGDSNNQQRCVHQCCSGTKNKAVVRPENDASAQCGCLPKGARVAGNAGLSCCSHYAENNGDHSICGGIPPLTPNQPYVWQCAQLFHLELSDCKYPAGGTVPEGDSPRRQLASQNGHTRDLGMNSCGPRPCAHQGNRPTPNASICCGSTDQAWNRTDSPTNVDCGCTPAGVQHSKFTTAKATDCCSGQYSDPDLRRCACIPDSAAIPQGADQNGGDCCSHKSIERNGTKYCKVDECTVQGKNMKSKGSWCCAGNTTNITYSQDYPCGCVWGGLAPVDGKKSRCCSESLDADGKCEWIETGGKVKEWFNKSECFSGEADANKQCMCMRPYSTRRSVVEISMHVSECCSGSIVTTLGNNRGRCSCIANGGPVEDGFESDCCSGKAKNNRCTCAPPGAPFKAGHGMHASDCCSSRASDHFCLCTEKGGDNVGACCGGLTQKKCDCIKDSILVPTQEAENASAVCCNAGASCADTCGN